LEKRRGKRPKMENNVRERNLSVIKRERNTRVLYRVPYIY
jgi:hypothetical protein